LGLWVGVSFPPLDRNIGPKSVRSYVTFRYFYRIFSSCWSMRIIYKN
jgi:hypothetical protein